MDTTRNRSAVLAIYLRAASAQVRHAALYDETRRLAEEQNAAAVVDAVAEALEAVAADEEVAGLTPDQAGQLIAALASARCGVLHQALAESAAPDPAATPPSPTGGPS